MLLGVTYNISPIQDHQVASLYNNNDNNKRGKRNWKTARHQYFHTLIHKYITKEPDT